MAALALRDDDYELEEIAPALAPAPATRLSAEPDFELEEVTPAASAPPATSPAATPVAAKPDLELSPLPPTAKGDVLAIPPPAAAPIGASSPWVRGAATGFAGTVEDAGSAAEVFRIVTGGNQDSILSRIGVALTDAGRGAGGGYERQEPSFAGVDTFGEGYTYLAETMASGFASTFPSLVGGAAGAAAGGAAGGPWGATGGAWAGSAIPSFVSGVGGAMSDLRADPGVTQALKDGKITEAQLANYALGTGALIGTLDAAGTGKIINLTGIGKAALRDTARQSVLAAVKKGIKEGVIAEGGTEAAQQILSEGAQVFLGGNLDLANRVIDVVDSFIGGMLVGGPVGGAAGGYEATRARGGKAAPGPDATGSGVLREPGDPDLAAATGTSSPGGSGATTAAPPAGAPASATEQAPIKQPTPERSGSAVLAPGEVDPALVAAAQPAVASSGTGPPARPSPSLPGVVDALALPPAITPGATTGVTDQTLAAALSSADSDQDAPLRQPQRTVEPAGTAQPTTRRDALPSMLPPVPGPAAPQPSLVMPPQVLAPAPAMPEPAMAPEPGSGPASPFQIAAAAPQATPVAPVERVGPAGPPMPAVSLAPAQRAMAAAADGLSVSAPLQEFELEEVTPTAPRTEPAAPLAVSFRTAPQRRAFTDLQEEIGADPAARAVASVFIAQQPAWYPRTRLLTAAREHLARWRADRDARESASRGAPVMRQRIAAETATSAERRAATAPERARLGQERDARIASAESSVDAETAARERGDDQGELDRALDETVRRALAEDIANDTEPHDASLDAALKAEAGRGGGHGPGGGGPGGTGRGSGGSGGNVPRARGERSRPGTPQAKNTRILRRAAKGGLRQALKSAGAKTRWFMRKWLSDAQLAEFNEHRFQWTDDIDPVIRTEANPMRQVAEARSRAAARRERLAAEFAPLLNRLDRLRRADRQLYDDLTQLMADASALTVDPTRPLSAPENQHLGQRFTEAGYQGRRAHPVLAAQFEVLAKADPEVASLWRDLQEAFAKRRELETRTRVVAVVRPMLDRANERARQQGRTPPATGQAEAEAIADRAIAKTLTKADKELISPSVQMAVEALVESGTVKGTYLPFTRQGQFVVHWLERMELPQGATWATNKDGTRSDSRFVGDNSAVNSFVKATLDDQSSNAGLIVRKIRAFRPGFRPASPMYRDEVSEGEWSGNTGKTAYEVEVQRDGMALYDTQGDADAALADYEQVADDVRLELRDEGGNGDILPSDLDELIRAAVRSLQDTLVDDATIELLDRSMRDALASTAAGNAASARNLRRKNVSGAEQSILRAADRYADASSGAVAKLAFAAEVDAGLRGMRASDEAQSRTDPAGQLPRQQVLREWGERVASLNDHYRVKGSAESGVQAALTASYLTRLADLSAVLIDSTQPYIFGLPRLSGRTNPVHAAAALMNAEITINTAKIAGRGIADTGRSTGEAVTKGAAFLARKAGARSAEGKRFERASHFDGIRKSVSSAKDGRDLSKMLDALADVGLLSRDSTLEIKAIDPDSLRGFNRILEPLADMARQLRIALDIRNQSVVAVAAYRIGRSQGDTHVQAVQFARDAVRQSQFDATFATSAPAFKTRGLARLPLQFKRFAVQSMIGMVRMMQSMSTSKGMTAAQKSEWRRIFATGNIVLLASAGASGHPLAMVAGLFMQAMAAAMGEPPREWEFEIETWLQELFAQEFGLDKFGAHDVAATIMRGLPSGLGPADISKRIGLGDLFTHGRPRSLDSKGVLEWIGMQLLGAPGETLVSPLDAFKAIRDGNFEKALEGITPKFIANVIRASKGGPEKATGEKLQRDGYSLAETIVKGIGFQPTKEADLRRQRTYQFAEIARRKVKGNGLRQAFMDAPTYPQKHIIYRRIQEFNRTLPEAARITDESLKRAQKLALKEQADDLFGGMKLSKGQRDIGEAGRRLNPADKPARKKIVEYDFD